MAAGLTALLLLTPDKSEAGNVAFVVDTTSDADLQTCGLAVGDCSLRGALQRVGTGDSIHFAIPTTDGNWDPADDIWSIYPTSPLPTLDENNVTIDGYTQPGGNGPGGSPNTNAPNQASNAVIKVEIDGILSNSNWGLLIDGDDNEVQGLAVGRFDEGFAIAITGGSGNRIAGNYIGTTPSGTSARGNQTGIGLASPANHVGGDTAADRNVIAASVGAGVLVATTGNTVRGNFIGLAANGAALGNNNGVEVTSVGVNFIGGSNPGQRNVISANAVNGIRIVGSDLSGNIIWGNYIGTTLAGTAPRGNGFEGIFVSAPDTIIGGAGSGEGNLISGNGGDGVQSLGPRNVISGNFIGTNAAGTAAIANVGNGVHIGHDGVILGTIEDNVVADNVISGNNESGVFVESEVASGATVKGNRIGTNAAGTAAVANGLRGVRILDTPGVVVGGTSPADRNLISGNATHGVILNGAPNVIVEGNYIGTSADGMSAIPNSAGLQISSGTTGSRIGGTTTGAGNLISGNVNDGINMDGTVSDIEIQGNLIGSAADGTTPLANSGDGIGVGDPLSDVLIGGTTTGAGNVIAFNNQRGINVDADSLHIQIIQNAIHSNGGLGIDLQPYGAVNVNDPGDADTGANNGQNYPILATAEAGSLHITGFFESLAGSYRFEFFANDVCDPLGHGEGQTFLAAATASLAVTGGVPFEVTLNVDVPPGKLITATATNQATGDTSEFSNCTEVFTDATPTPTPPGQTPSPTPTVTPPGQTATPTPTATPPGQTATPTPTDTPPGQTPTPTDEPDGHIWGDIDCLGGVDPVDSLKLLRFDAGLSVAQGANCPPIGEPYQFDNSEELWGDIDCSDTVDPVDSLKVLRFDAGLSVAQGPSCPEIGLTT